MYCLKMSRSLLREFLKPDNTRLRVFLNAFKISDIDQLILALIFRFAVILV